jgi:hypothetical protein
MTLLWEILYQTPWWVFVLFFYLLKVGFDASRTQVFPFNRLFILPTIFLIMSVNTLSSLSFTPLALFAYLFSLLLGLMGGWMIVSNQDIKFDKQRALIQLPGTRVNLAIILIVFSVKYYLSYSTEANPEIIKTLPFQISLLTTSGLCTGFFIGRLGCIIFRRNRESSLDLG